MKAVVYDKYGRSDILKLEEMPIPQAKEGEVVVKVAATSINAGDLHMRNGEPFIARLYAGLFRPKQRILGTTFSGEIVGMGSQVQRFEIGDQVFGSLGNRFGTHTEYLVIKEEGLIVKKPQAISHKAAATLAFGPQTGLYFLRKTGQPLEDKSILVIGASGGVGSALVQLAKSEKMVVTGIASGATADWVLEIGADRVIDYKKEDILKLKQTYDFIFDTTSYYKISGLKKLLNKNGTLIRLELSFSTVLNMLLPSKIGKKIIFDVSKVTREDLLSLSEMVLSGDYKPLIEKTYPIESFREAHQHAEKSGKKGSVVMVMQDHME